MNHVMRSCRAGVARYRLSYEARGDACGGAWTSTRNAMTDFKPDGTPDDRDLIQRLVQRDEGAAGLLYDRHGGVVYSVAYRLLGEQADAEEVVIETFAQAWREAGRFDPARGTVRSWLVTISRSRAMDLARSAMRRHRIEDDAGREGGHPSLAASPGFPDTSARAELNERRDHVLAALGELSDVQRQAVELAYYEGLSQSEIADRTQQPLGTVKTRLRLAMKKLRDSLVLYQDGSHE